MVLAVSLGLQEATYVLAPEPCTQGAKWTASMAILDVC